MQVRLLELEEGSYFTSREAWAGVCGIVGALAGPSWVVSCLVLFEQCTIRCVTIYAQKNCFSISDTCKEMTLLSYGLTFSCLLLVHLYLDKVLFSRSSCLAILHHPPTYMEKQR